MTPKILVIRFSSLGDVILASSPVLNLNIGFPNGHITFLTKSRFESLVQRIPGVSTVVTISDSPTVTELYRLIRRLENEDFDIIVDLQGNFRSYLVQSLLTASQKVVYPRDRAARIRVIKEKEPTPDTSHTIDKYNECLKMLGLKAYSQRPIIGSFPAPNSPASSPTIVFAPGASAPNKQWPIARMAEVASILRDSTKAKIIWATTAADNALLDIDVKIGRGNLQKLVDFPIDQLADIIRNSHLCIANDSGIAHLSSAVGTPAIAIFGPTHPALGFAPRGLSDKVIQVDEFCRPCSLHGDKPCYRQEQFCFNRISPSMVVSEVTEILERRLSQARALFVDRDGTVIVDKPFDSNPDTIEFESGSIEALLKVQKLGLKIIIVSNQSGVARGFFKFADAEVFNGVLAERLKENGIIIDAVYFCPHYPQGTVLGYARECYCRKPAPGMAEKAARELNVDLRRSYVVGDKLDDFNLGRIIGATSYLVKTGQGFDYIDQLGNICQNSRDFICENLNEAVTKIEELEKQLN
jgi:heptosyltransferase-2